MIFGLSKKDRPLWGEGIWQNEPDNLLWIYKNYQCEIRRNALGYLNSFVFLESNHPLYGIEKEKISSILNINLNRISEINNLNSDKLWRLEKFLAPLDYKFERPHNYKIDPSTYKDMKFAKKECKKIVDALCLTYPE